MKNLFLLLLPYLFLSGLRAESSTLKINDPGDAILSDLMTTLGRPTSTVNASQTDYYLRDAEYAESSIMVTPYLTNPNASMQISINDGAFTNIANGQSSSPLPLKFGDNIIKIVVTPLGRADIIYKFMFRRNRSSDANLSDIMTTVGRPTSGISPLQTDYFLPDAAYSESSIRVTPYLSNRDASMQVRIGTEAFVNIASGANSDQLTLGFGDNTIEIRVTAQDQSVRTYKFMVRRNRSSDASLSDIMTTVGRPTSSISPLQTDYFLPDAAYSESSIRVTPYLSNADASMQVRIGTEAFANIASGANSNELTLGFGDNTIEIRVTAQDQSVRTYKFMVRRNLSSDASLSSITTSIGNPTTSISPSQSDYYLPNADYSAGSMMVTPYLSNGDASMQIRINSEPFANIGSAQSSTALSLNFGDNTIEIRVTAQDLSTRTYKFMVRRNRSSDASLSSITTSIGNPTTSISPSQSDYYLPNADYSASSMMVTPYLSNVDASMQIRINSDPFTSIASAQSSAALSLNVGDNIIEIRVTAQDESTRTYKFMVRRNRSFETDLSALTISAGTLTPAFSAAVLTYTVNVTNSISSIKMTPTLANPDAIIEIKINDGDYVRLQNNAESDALPLNVGENTVLIRITLQDGPSPVRNARVAEVTNIYEFIVTRDNPLPVTLIAFTGKKSGEAQSRLNWVTADEKDFFAFEIQKSIDTRNFEKVGDVAAKQANGSYLNAYTFYDDHASEPAIYYRLKMIDTDGSFTFSRIISINSEAEIGVVGEFYPNPVLTENVSVDIVATASGIWKISAIDILGTEINLAEKELITGENKVSIPVFSLKSGINFIRFENSGLTFVRKIIRL